MKKLLIPHLLASVLLALPAITIPTVYATEHGTTSGLHTPAPGTPERKAILNAQRKQLQPLVGDTVLVVSYLKVNKGWAWLAALPQSPDGSNHYEGVNSLLHYANGSWKVVDGRPSWGECETDPDCADDTRFFKKLRAKHPGVPSNIFPH